MRRGKGGKLFFILFFLLIISLSFIYAFDSAILSPERVFGISSGMSAPEIVVAVSMLFILFMVVYSLLKIPLGNIFGVILAIPIVILIAYFRFLNSFFVFVTKIVISAGAIGTAALLIAAFVFAVLFHLSTNRLAIWWLRTRVKLRARRFVFFACFIFLLILMQFLVSAQQTPSIPGEKEVQQLPYALNRTQSSFLKYYEGFTGFLSNTCTSLKQTTKHIIGIECSSTWVFVITLFLWLFMILIIADALTNFSTFSTLPSFLIAFALAVIAANLGVTKLISNLITAVFGSFVTGIIIGLIILGIIIVLKVTGEKFKQSREKAKEEKKETVFKKAELQTKMVGEALK